VGAGVGAVTCAQVGEHTDTGIVLSEQCVDPSESDGGIPMWSLALIIILVILILVALVYIIFMNRKLKSAILLSGSGGQQQREVNEKIKEP